MLLRPRTIGLQTPVQRPVPSVQVIPCSESQISLP
jgi:hypothetical protein